MERKGNPRVGALVSLVVLVALAYGIFQNWVHDTFPEPTDVEVTDLPMQREGILPGAKYLLPPDLFLCKRDHYVLEKPLPGQVDRPKSKAEYQEDPSHWPNIGGVLGEGATIRVDKIYRYARPWIGSDVRVVGRVTDGERVYENVVWWRPSLNEPLK